MMKIGGREGDDSTGSIESGSAADEAGVLLGMNTVIVECSGSGGRLYGGSRNRMIGGDSTLKFLWYI